MADNSSKHFTVRNLRMIMSLLVLVAALVFGSLVWSVLAIFVPAGHHPILSAVVVLAATAFGAAGGVLAIGRIIRARVPEAADPSRRKENKDDDEGKLLGNIINSLEGGLMTISSAGTITSFNSVAQRTLGHEAKDVVGRHFGAVFANVAENRALREMIKSALTAHRTASSVEVEAMAVDGSPVALGVTISLLRAEAGRHKGIVLTFKNLAELNQIREQVERTHQLAYLGRLSAGMAHEIRNPLGALRGLVELMHEDFARDDPKWEYTSTILRTIDRLNTLVENLLAFCQPAVADMEPVDVCGLTRECVELCAIEQEGRNVSLREYYSAGSLYVQADRASLARAIINIVRNAYQATPENGAVAVSAGGRPPRLNDEPGQAVIAITNSGSYINPDDRSKVFAPFYTTKSDGTGLGLPIANQIVTAHAGQVEIDSEMDTGTTFNITLPLCSAGEEAAAEVPVRSAANG